MLGKIIGGLTIGAGYRSYTVGLVMTIVGVAVFAGLLPASEADQIQALLTKGIDSLFGLGFAGGGLGLIFVRAALKRDTKALEEQLAQLRVALEAVKEEKR